MLTVAVQQDAADGCACLHLGNGTGHKIEAIEPSVAAVLQNDAVAAICIVCNRDLHSDGAVAIICDVEHGHAHIVIGGACCDIIDSNILLKALGIRKGHINGLSTLFNDYLMCWDLLEGIGIGCYTGGDVYQVTILIILDIQEIITFVVATEVAAGALVANNDPGHSRSHLRGILVGGIGIGGHQVINTICLRHIHSDGVGICTVIIQLGNFFPITAIQFDLQILAAVHGNKVLSSCGSAPLLGLDSNAAAALCYFVNILIEGSKVAVVVKTPVGEHSHINGITIRQQGVVGGRTPAGTHVGVAVIAIVH